ncbi:hypothetical protein [Streptomyces flavofungini]|uniref:hypothetical protein n=1 Tax=Streptomyces flavofungini TaxID=68200 RepID=UPI0034DF489C
MRRFWRNADAARRTRTALSPAEQRFEERFEERFEQRPTAHRCLSDAVGDQMTLLAGKATR